MQGFFYSDNRTKQPEMGGLSLDLLHKHGCTVCPLNNQPGLHHPHMEPYGTDKPVIYIIGEAPGEDEDRKGIPFVGKAGRTLHLRIPEEVEPLIRWNNCVRTRPPKNRNPTTVELECFPAGTKVTPLGQIKTLYRRWYNGPVVTLKTARGNDLTGTPNHPIFTIRGKTPFQQLKVGDYLINTATSNITAPLFWSPDGNNKPTSIDKVFSTFSKVFKIDRIWSRSLDFHGDGVNGYVDVIRTDRELLNGSESSFNQHFENFDFTRSNSTTRTLMCYSPLTMRASVFAMIVTFLSFFCSMGLVPTIGSFRSRSKLNPITLQNSGYRTCANTFRLSDLLKTLTSIVLRYNICSWLPAPASQPNLISTGPHLNFLFSQVPSNRQAINTKEGSDTFNTLPSDVELDRIVSIEWEHNFSGHVYNLETETGTYIAENLKVNNCCRSSIVEDIEATKPIALFGMGNVPLQWALNQSRITNWTKRHIPIKVGSHTCWFFPFVHPSYVMRSRRHKQDGSQVTPRHSDEYGSEIEFAFAHELKTAFDLVLSGNLEPPVVHTEEYARENVDYVTGDSGQQDVDRVVDFLQIAANEKTAGFDYETSCLRPYSKQAKILTAAVSTKHESFAFPLYHKQASWSDSQREVVESALVNFIYTAQCRKIVHQLSFEMEWTAWFYGNASLRAGKWEDTVTQAYTLDERRGMHSLDTLCLQYFGINLKALSPDLDKNNLDNEDLERILPYNALDAKYHRLLHLKQIKRVHDEGLTKTYRHLVRRVPTMVLTQIKGVPVDQTVVRKFHKQYTDELEKIEAQIQALNVAEEFRRVKGFDYRPSAPHDARFAITRLLKLRADGGMKESDLDKIDHPLTHLTVKYRKAAKNLSTYVKPLMKGSPHLYPDGLLHPTIKTTGTRTSRTSSEDPNCFPSNVEVLTKNGWTKWGAVLKNDLLAQFDLSNNKISFSKPVQLIEKNHDGPLLRIKTVQQLDIECTLDHRFPLDRGIREKYPHRNPVRWCTADKIPNYYRILQAGLYLQGKTKLRPPQVILISAFQADAYYNKQYGYIDWLLIRPRKIERLRQALRAEQVQFNEKPARGGVRFYVPKRFVPSWLLGKKHYGSWLLDLDYNTLKLFAEELWHWDGGVNKTDFCTGHEGDASWAQIMLTLTNRRAWVTTRKSVGRGSLFVNAGETNFSHTSNNTKSIRHYKGKVHCATMPKGTLIVRYNGRVCVTGNCQNFPKRKTREVRKQIRPSGTRRIVAFDYAGMQARNVAMESKDKALVKAFWNRYDIHTDWRERIIHHYPSWIPKNADKDILKKYRERAKNEFVFPSFFGAQPKSMSEHLGIPVAKGTALFEEFWSMFPDIKKWHDRVRSDYRLKGYVTGLAGVRRRAPVAFNEQINSPIQALEAFLVCEAMSRLSEYEELRYQANLEIHDDLTFVWEKDDIDHNMEVVITEMLRITHPWINVPLQVEVSIGEDWASLSSSDDLIFASDTWSIVNET